jgi:phosphate starvation-inducible PhoH-like protein
VPGDFREKLSLDDNHLAARLYGAGNAHLKRLSAEFGVEIGARGNEITLSAADIEALSMVRRILEELYALTKKSFPLGMVEVERAILILRDNPRANLATIFLDTVFVSSRGKNVAPKGVAQKAYIDSIRNHDIVFGIGPAGTGKTFMAMACAVAALARREVKRIVLCRPAVEAGERLGFLPGDLAEKVNPYLRPLYDALHDMMDSEKAQALIRDGIIEVAPLAFMRGRTLNDSFVILDESQNTTPEQMKMFLTRLGFESKAVITGDLTQVDLPSSQRSGLLDARETLSGVEDIKFCYFSDVDVVRHPLVQAVIRAYDRADALKRQAKEAREARLRSNQEEGRTPDGQKS